MKRKSQKRQARSEVNLIKDSDYVKSFRNIDLGFLKAILADFFLFICVLLVVGVFLGLMYSSLIELSSLAPMMMYIHNYVNENGELPVVDESLKEQLDKGTDTIKQFLLKSGIYIFGTLVLLITVDSLFKGYIYSILNKTRLRPYLKTFMKINISWSIFWIFLMLATFLILNPLLAAKVFVFELVLYVIFTPALRSVIKKGDRIKDALDRFTKKALKRLFRTMLAVVAVYITYSLLMILLNFLLASINIFELTSFVLFIFILVFMAWARRYMFMTINKVEA